MLAQRVPAVPLPFFNRRIDRRRFMAGSAGVVASGLIVGATAYSARGTRATAVTIEAAGAPFAFLSDDTVPQGGAFSVHLSTFDAVSATATFHGRQIDLLPDGDWLVGLFGAGQEAGDEQELDPGDYTVAIAARDATGVARSVSLSITVATTDFPVDRIDLPPSIAALLAPELVAAEVDTLHTVYAPVSPKAMWSGLFLMPVAGPITTNFGQARSYNGGQVSGHHSGVDIGADLGTPIAAPAAGVVAYTGPLSDRGNFIAIDHGLGVFSGYAHLSRISTTLGAVVAVGDIIGNVGTTGLSTGPHLHWEVAVHGINVDALRWTWNLLP